jgi:ABC-type transport system involved in multi-copper enzyme maturation permease subunit
MSSLAMEWQKLRPLYKTSRTVAVVIGLAVTVSAVVATAMAGSAGHMSGLERQHFDSIGISLQGVNAAVLAVAVFGVLCVTREYASGMIAATFLAEPSRLRVLAAKLGTHALVACVAAVLACVAAFAVGQALLATAGLSVGWGAEHLAGALGGGAVYLVLVCTWGVALGALVRSSSMAITWLVALLVVVPVIVQIMPASVVQAVGRWLPSQIGMRAIASHPDPHAFGEWTGLAVLAAYVALTLAVGAWRMARTDP